MKTLRDLDYSILQQCIHCGMCLPSCPTYTETKVERNSPRGRIALMRAVADGELSVTKEFGQEMYYCLGCLACTSACPAGVNYAELFEVARADVEQKKVLETPKRRAIRWFALRLLFTRPRLLRFAGRILWLYQASGLQRLARATVLKVLPRSLRALETQTPHVRRHFSHQLIARLEPPVVPASPGGRPRRVLVLTGCVQDLLYPEVNRATVDVLRENGCEVHTPAVQPCCGSLHAHNGDIEGARLLARRQLDRVDPADFDAIISNAGGCGSHLRHYDHLLEDDPRYAARAREWSLKLRDVSEYLVEIGLRPAVAPAAGTATPVTYHESCHLCHGQKVSAQPRAVLRAAGAEVWECAEATWCCGSAGIYSLTHPDTAQWLQQRKWTHLRATGADTVALANPGCHLHLENGLRGVANPPRIVHPVVLLAEAYRAEKKPAAPS